MAGNLEIGRPSHVAQAFQFTNHRIVPVSCNRTAGHEPSPHLSLKLNLPESNEAANLIMRVAAARANLITN